MSSDHQSGCLFRQPTLVQSAIFNPHGALPHLNFLRGLGSKVYHLLLMDMKFNSFQKGHLVPQAGSFVQCHKKEETLSECKAVPISNRPFSIML